MVANRATAWLNSQIPVQNPMQTSSEEYNIPIKEPLALHQSILLEMSLSVPLANNPLINSILSLSAGREQKKKIKRKIFISLSPLRILSK